MQSRIRNCFLWLNDDEHSFLEFKIEDSLLCFSQLNSKGIPQHGWNQFLRDHIKTCWTYLSSFFLFCMYSLFITFSTHLIVAHWCSNWIISSLAAVILIYCFTLSLSLSCVCAFANNRTTICFSQEWKKYGQGFWSQFLETNLLSIGKILLSITKALQVIVFLIHFGFIGGENTSSFCIHAFLLLISTWQLFHFFCDLLISFNTFVFIHILY